MKSEESRIPIKHEHEHAVPTVIHDPEEDMPQLRRWLTHAMENPLQFWGGVAAVAVVLAGATMRLKAPIVAGGIVLVVVAWHEIVLVWDHLPRWAPLAVAGALLVGVAVTYERRMRDVARMRAAVGRMR